MGGVFPNDTTIYIGKTDALTTDLYHVDNKVVGEIEKFNLSGGNQDVESVPVIGGYVDKEKPREQFEVSFDIVVSNLQRSTFDRWDAFKFGKTSTDDEYASNLEPDLTPSTGSRGGTIAIVMSTAGAAPYKVYAFNNVKAVTWEPEMNADDMLRGTITFKFSPTTNLGAPNLKTSTVTNYASWPTDWL